jgi:hypothetical protein
LTLLSTILCLFLPFFFLFFFRFLKNIFFNKHSFLGQNTSKITISTTFSAPNPLKTPFFDFVSLNSDHLALFAAYSAQGQVCSPRIRRRRRRHAECAVILDLPGRQAAQGDAAGRQPQGGGGCQGRVGGIK